MYFEIWLSMCNSFFVLAENNFAKENTNGEIIPNKI